MDGILHATIALLVYLGQQGSSAESQPPRELQTPWADLAEHNPVKAQQALTVLVDRPAQTLPFLEKQLRAVPVINPRRLARLIEELDSDRFTVRRKATQELERLG